eukprot:scaffold10274_cov106-Isochrysis_galbana.AAC.7
MHLVAPTNASRSPTCAPTAFPLVPHASYTFRSPTCAPTTFPLVPHASYALHSPTCAPGRRRATRCACGRSPRPGNQPRRAQRRDGRRYHLRQRLSCGGRAPRETRAGGAKGKGSVVAWRWGVCLGGGLLVRGGFVNQGARGLGRWVLPSVALHCCRSVWGRPRDDVLAEGMPPTPTALFCQPPQADFLDRRKAPPPSFWPWKRLSPPPRFLTARNTPPPPLFLAAEMPFPPPPPPLF